MQCSWCLDDENKQQTVLFHSKKSSIFKDLLGCNSKIMKSSKQDLTLQHRISLKKSDLLKVKSQTFQTQKSVKQEQKSPLSTSFMFKSVCFPQQRQMSTHFLQPQKRCPLSPRSVEHQHKSQIQRRQQQPPQKVNFTPLIIPKQVQNSSSIQRPIFLSISTRNSQTPNHQKQASLERNNHNHTSSIPINISFNEYLEQSYLINQVKYYNQQIKLFNFSIPIPLTIQDEEKIDIVSQFVKSPANHNIEQLACKKTLSVGNGSQQDQFSQVIFGYRRNMEKMRDSLTGALALNGKQCGTTLRIFQTLAKQSNSQF